MPIYEYECQNCGELTEAIFSMKEDIPAITCPFCCSRARKIISRPQAVAPLWEEYWEENLGHEPVLIKGRRHRKEVMKANGLEEVSYDKTKKRILIEKHEHNKQVKKEELKHG